MDKSIHSRIGDNATGVNITGADSTVTSTVTIKQLQQNKFEDLSNSLAKHGLAKQDIEELKRILNEEQGDAVNKKAGPKAQSWVKGAAKKIYNLTESTAGMVLAEYIGHYYGWS